jgi:succinate dehydrogenase / fumarate reductase cytochrome b subunit
MIGEIILVFLVLFHGVNGLRLALFDLIPRFWTSRYRDPSLRSVFFASIVLWVPAAIIMGRNLIEHNFLGG